MPKINQDKWFTGHT